MREDRVFQVEGIIWVKVLMEGEYGRVEIAKEFSMFGIQMYGIGWWKIVLDF